MTLRSRRSFLGQAAGSSFAAWLGLGLVETQWALAQSGDSPPAPAPGATELPDPPAEFPRQATSEVAAVVGAAHTQLDRVRELVTARPRLANATYDWGFGDWESALGAASHMGRRDIAEVLIEHGARPDIFAFTLLGEVDVVRAIVTANPGIERTAGPHGITLLAHARTGAKRNDDDAAKVTLEYIASLEGADQGQESRTLSPSLQKRYYGEFRFGAGENQTLEIEKHVNGRLALSVPGQTTRILHMVGDHTFAPSGAPEVRVVFKLQNNLAKSLTVHDPLPIVHAVRF